MTPNEDLWVKQWFLKGCGGRRSGCFINSFGIHYFFFDESDVIERLLKAKISLPDAEPFRRVLRPTDKVHRATYQTPA